MATLFDAVDLLRERRQLPTSGTVRVKDLLQRFRPSYPSHPGSVRALLLKIEGFLPTTRWAIVIVTQTGIPSVTSLPLYWFERLFNDGDGVATYIRQMSGNRQVFTWRVFGPLQGYTPEKKAELATQGAAAESIYLRAEAAKQSIINDVSDFDRFFWVIDQPGASGGTSGGGDIFIAARDVTQQIVSHEICHAFGVVFEGDKYDGSKVQTYGDSFCQMDNGPSARSFPNERMAYTQDGDEHRTTGPVMCAAHLFVVNWLDYDNNVVEHTAEASKSDIVIDANQGAPAIGRHNKVALTIGPVPRNNNETQLWVEFRSPLGFDRFVDRPVSTDNVDMPQGALVMHEMRTDRHVILVGLSPAKRGNSLQIPGSGQSVEIVNINTTLRNVRLRIRAT